MKYFFLKPKKKVVKFIFKVIRRIINYLVFWLKFSFVQVKSIKEVM